jgi:aspartyl-tRNA(Asn)/glutamyl-tRNA(Gln) amidotransferase subunit C
MSTAESVSIEDVRRVAELANLELTAEEEPRMQRDLNAILGHVQQLQQLDTTGVPIMAQVGDLLAHLRHDAQVDVVGGELRPDRIRPSVDRAAVMQSAPETDGRFFKVPKVIER